MTFRGGSIVAVATTIMIEVTSNYQVEYGEYTYNFFPKQFGPFWTLIHFP